MIRRIVSDERGATAVETALILPAFLLVVFGIIEFGRGVWVQAALQYAVSQAARCASLQSSSCTDVPSYAASNTLGLTVPSSTFTYTSGASCGITAYTKGYQVTASYQFSSVVGGLIPQLASITLRAKSCHP